MTKNRWLYPFTPDKTVAAIGELDAVWLRDVLRIRGVLLDLDNTLATRGEKYASQPVGKWLEELRTAGLQILVLSNNRGRSRVSDFCLPLGIPYIQSANKPLRGGFVQALERLGMTAEEVVMVGDRRTTDVWGAKRMGIYSVLVRRKGAKS